MPGGAQLISPYLSLRLILLHCKVGSLCPPGPCERRGDEEETKAHERLEEVAWGNLTPHPGNLRR